MDERIRSFLDRLRACLAVLPDSEAREAVEYYEEYINDALDEGGHADEILSHLGSPEIIAAQVMAEASIKMAQQNPGLKNYSKALKYSRILITRPFSIMMFSMLLFVTYGMALLFFIGAAVFAAASLAAFSGMLFEALKIPSRYIPEIIGTASIGLVASATILLSACGLFILGRLCIKLSVGIVRHMLKKPGEAGKSQTYADARGNRPHCESGGSYGDTGAQAGKRRSVPARISKACIAAIFAGLALSFASGLPVKLFMIFDGMKPAHMATHRWEYGKSEVGGIYVVTAHSHIRLVESDSDKIEISYEQPDWLEPEIKLAGGRLSFTENSNGRLPLFSLVSMHESRTDLVLALPGGFAPEALKLESRGGFIYIDTGSFSADVRTYTGNIYIGQAAASTASIKAATSAGIIMAGGNNAGNKSANGIVYETAATGGKSITAETSRGSVFIR